MLEYLNRPALEASVIVSATTKNTASSVSHHDEKYVQRSQPMMKSVSRHLDSFSLTMDWM